MANQNPTSSAHVQEPGDDEVVVFDDHPSITSFLFQMIVYGLAELLLLLLGFYMIFTGAAAGWYVVLATAVLGCIPVVYWFISCHTTRYRITNYRIDVESGLIAKRYDTLELWHVDDVSLNQTVTDRLGKVGTIKVVSDDTSTPVLELWGMANPKSIFDHLKTRIIAVKRQRGVIKFDPGE